MFVPPDVAYGFQDTSLLVVMPEFVAGRLDIETSVDDDGVLPDGFALEQNFPNPFNPTTTIHYAVAGLGANTSSLIPVQISVSDILGRVVATLLDEPRPPGTYEIQFDATHLPSGVYYCVLRAADFTATRKMVLLK